MAIYNAVPPPPELTSNLPAADSNAAAAASNGATATVSLTSHVSTTTSSATGIDIDAWTISALQSLSVSPVARGTGTPLAIPIDDHEHHHHHTPKTVRVAAPLAETATPRRPPSRRDSQRKREAVLKGKEGSRQRRRWENDRLMHVPNAQPPEPRDWEARPTHVVHAHGVPYQLAQFWDRGVRQRVEDKSVRLAASRKAQQLKAGSATGLRAGEVPRDLRETTKRAPVVRSWVRTLEEPVRQFLQNRPPADHQHRGDGDEVQSDGAEAEIEDKTSSDDDDDEQIVFAGRKSGLKAQRQRSQWKMAHRELGDQTVDQGMVFDSFGDDESAAFKRWLTHSISDYYGLESTSVIMKNPSRKVVYVQIKQFHQQTSFPLRQFPRPLWELC